MAGTLLACYVGVVVTDQVCMGHKVLICSKTYLRILNSKAHTIRMPNPRELRCLIVPFASLIYICVLAPTHKVHVCPSLSTTKTSSSNR